jgi:homoserine dehydrogenase
MGRPKKTASETRIALAGIGTVGSAVARLLVEEAGRYEEEIGARVTLAAVLDRRYRELDLSWLPSEAMLTDSLHDFLAAPSDIVVELLGGSDPADQIVSTALQQQKAVVTANKLLMARHGVRYLNLAVRHNAYLGFEASVAGGIPIIRALRRSLFADRTIRIRGILNGTCNFILSEMAESGREFQDVLAQAQALGYAEADPSLDVSGRDTADKLSILGGLSFGRWIPPAQIPTRGISEIWPIDLLYSQKVNARIRLLGVAEMRGDSFFLRVSPFLVDHRLALSTVSGVLNAIEVAGKRLGSTVYVGRGAGGNPTAVSVVADILNAALWKQGRAVFHRNVIVGGEAPAPTAADRETYPFYIRFFVKDQTGIIAALASILARRKININAVLQENWPDPYNLPFIVTVEPTPFPTMQEAVAEMSALEFNRVPPLALPMLVE